MWTGEVEMKVWMRPRLAGLIASPQRSMSFWPARARPAIDRVLGALGDLVDGHEVAFRGDRETGLDDVDAHLVEQLGDLELLLMGHGGAGALLAVAQGGVEDDDAVLVGLCWRGHGSGSFSSLAPSSRGAHGVPIASGNPLSARARTPLRPPGDAKEQEPAENEGSAGPGLFGPPVDRAAVAADRHRFPQRDRRHLPPDRASKGRRIR